jgi:hypothetical protein
MKAVTLIFFLLFSFITLSQESLLTEEWYQKLDSDLEYIVFPNPSKGAISLRIYRGKSESHDVTIRNAIGDIVVHLENCKREEDFDLSNLEKGFYLFTVSNEKKSLTEWVLIK